jgi:hypothetical protein
MAAVGASLPMRWGGGEWNGIELTRRAAQRNSAQRGYLLAERIEGGQRDEPV